MSFVHDFVCYIPEIEAVIVIYFPCALTIICSGMCGLIIKYCRKRKKLGCTNSITLQIALQRKSIIVICSVYESIVVYYSTT